MSNWEYKVISSGKGGFASPALMEKFLNDLGQEHWEILSFHTLPENPLAFTGLARRSTQRDWTLEDAAAAAARAEADKLRAEFEAKFKAGTKTAVQAEEQTDTFLAEEKVGTDDGLRRLRDTSRDDDPDAPEDETAPKDDWDKLAEEDELPTFFDALRPHMRRNQRGPGMSVGVDYLAKKWKFEESDIKSALVECGMQIPADENARPVYVEYEGDLYWVNINRRGEVWINTREKPQPVFRVVAGKRLTDEESAAAMPQQGGGQSHSQNEPQGSVPHSERRDQGERERDRERERESAPRPPRQQATSEPSQSGQGGQAEQSARNFLSRVRGLMRRNRRGHGWSGSFPFLTKAFKTDEPGLLGQLAEHGVVLPPEGSDEPVFHEDGDFVYWMNKNQRGEIWINARKGRKPENGRADDEDSHSDEGGSEEMTATGGSDAQVPRPDGETAASPENSAASGTSTESVRPSQFEEPSVAPTESSRGSTDNTLAAVRLLLQPKKRGDGVAALVSTVAQQLGQTDDVLIGALVAAGLNVPDDSKSKPSFGEHAGEIFWLNRSAKGDLWLNAKASRSGGRKSRSRKAGGEEVSEDASEPAEENE